ncbi:MAG: type II toxin-antitoxin system RelE/ParE family toxin [Sinobacteraceae bacterium]|nr:type II toxin-antitoxin system RelE/ParE family toxin [Nevskiaceae bacterium]
MALRGSVYGGLRQHFQQVAGDGCYRVARFVNFERPALRKLKQLDLARRIEDLRAPPANRLEQLKGDRAGQWSLRINDQFRLCFRWTGNDAEDVEIVDYH